MPPVSWAAPEQQAARCRLQVGSPALAPPGHSCQWGRPERVGLPCGAGRLAAWAAAGLLPDQAAGCGAHTAQRETKAGGKKVANYRIAGEVLCVAARECVM